MNTRQSKQLSEKLKSTQTGKKTVGGFTVPRTVPGERTTITRIDTPKPKMKVLGTATGRIPQEEVKERADMKLEPGMPGFNSFVNKRTKYTRGNKHLQKW